MPHGVQPPSWTDLIVIINELRADLNALRTDFRAHDHGATYAVSTIRLAAAPLTFSGTAESSSAVASPDLPVPPVA